jgi:hypothetical protein
MAAQSAAVTAAETPITARQPKASTSMRSGTPAKTPPTTPMNSAMPEASANWRGANQWLASLSIETKPTATEAPISRRPGVGPEERRREGEQRRAERGDAGAGGEQLSRPPAVGDDAGRDLHRHVGVEIEGGEVAQRRRADGEVVHQLVGDDGRRDALVEAMR